MIFTERKITVRKGKSSIDESVILYRGDYEVELRFTIMETKYRFKSGVNLVDSEKASHAQLALLAPDGTNVFTEVGRCEDGTAIFVLSKEMIDELSEVGLYSFQIRLFDYYRESRITIPPVEFGIEVREPIAAEDHINTVDDAMVGYSIAKTSVLDEPVPETFNPNGQYNKTDWETGDRISEGKLNKIEDAIDQINQNEKNDVAALDKRITNNFNTLNVSKADINDVASISKGTPAFASSVDKMTDSSLNYVNTSDGYLYVYDKGSFVKTDIMYQATGFNDNSVGANHVKFLDKSSKVNAVYYDAVFETVSGVPNVRLSSVNEGNVAVVSIQPNTTYIIEPKGDNNRFRIAASYDHVAIDKTLKPLNALLYSDATSGNTKDAFTFTNTEGYGFLYIYLNNAVFAGSSVEVIESKIFSTMIPDKSIDLKHLSITSSTSSSVEYFNAVYATIDDTVNIVLSASGNGTMAKVRLAHNKEYSIKAGGGNNRFRITASYASIIPTNQNQPTDALLYSDATFNDLSGPFIFRNTDNYNYLYVYLSNEQYDRLPIEVLSEGIDGSYLNDNSVDASKLRGSTELSVTNTAIYTNIFINSQPSAPDTRWLTYRDGCNSMVLDATNMTSISLRVLEQNDMNRFRILQTEKRFQDIRIEGANNYGGSDADKFTDFLYLDDDIPNEYVIKPHPNVQTIVVQVTDASCKIPPVIEVTYNYSNAIVLDNLYVDYDHILNKPDIPTTGSTGPMYTVLGNGGIYKAPIPGITPSRETKTADIYAIYEELLAKYPHYVTREELGVDSYGNKLYGYTFDKEKPPIQDYNDPVFTDMEHVELPKMKFILNGGTHGDEKTAAVALAVFMKSLCEDMTDPSLRFIRANTILKVIPILNPSGFDDCTRENRKGININRDFNDVTQPETRIAINFIDANPDALAVLDMHNTVGKPSYWNFKGDLFTRQLTLTTLNNVSELWIERDDTLVNHLPLGLLVDSTSGTMKDYANSKGMITTSVESSRHSSSITGTQSWSYDAGAVVIGIELLSNLMITIMNYYS